MLKDIKVKNIHGKTRVVGHFENIQAAIEFAVLIKVSLEGANLRGAKLEGANLEGANLRSANLEGANLRSANLRNANLEGANLRSANLRNADLRNADLDFAGISLRCASTHMIVCDRFIGQMAYHLTRVNYSNCSEEVQAALKVVERSVLGNLFLKYRDDLKRV